MSKDMETLASDWLSFLDPDHHRGMSNERFGKHIKKGRTELRSILKECLSRGERIEAALDYLQHQINELEGYIDRAGRYNASYETNLLISFNKLERILRGYE